MKKSVLLISDGGGFMIDALANNIIKTAGLTVHRANPTVEELKAKAGNAEIFLLYAGDYVHDVEDYLKYLDNICSVQNKVLIIVGYDKELEEISQSVSDESISRKVPRPFDMRKLAEDIEAMTVTESGSDAEKSKHILLVDDDGSYLKMMQSWLSPYYKLTIVNSGMQAITYIATNTPDLILLDYDMPITPGSQVLEMIRSEPSSAGIPVIFLTGRSDRESVEKVMRLKPEGYLLKSMKKQDIVDAVNRFFIKQDRMS